MLSLLLVKLSIFLQLMVNLELTRNVGRTTAQKNYKYIYKKTTAKMRSHPQTYKGNPKWCLAPTAPPKDNAANTAELLELGGNVATAPAVKENLKLLHLADERHLQLKVDAVVDVSQRTSVLSKLFQRRVR